MTGNRHWGDFELASEAMLERLRAVAPLEAPGDAIRAFYGYYAERQGKPRWGDKTPGYATKMRRIWRALPEARFIHMIRDGRDVAVSLERRQSGPLHRGGREPLEPPDPQDAQTRGDPAALHGAPLRGPRQRTRRASCGKVSAFVELDYDPAMLSYHERSQERLRELERPLRAEEGKRGLTAESRLESHALTAEPPRTDRVGAWREELAPEDVAIFEKRAGKLLEELGYDRAPSQGSE